MKATRADIERQFEATKAQIDATSERIQARTGRNLILAILIGLVLGFAMLFSLIVIKELFLLFGAFIVFFTSYELTQALRRSGRMVPVIPAVLATVGMIPLTWFFGGAGQWLGLMGGLVLMIAWRVVETLLPGRHVSGRQLLRDAGASVLVLVYVGLFTSFTVLTIARDGGQWWVLAFLILVIVADTAAYASGLSFGRHPMAPSISPKKTWEGFAGAVLACLVGGVLLAVFMLQEPWWFGLVLGVSILLSATLGDLSESLLKRDLGIKDMSSWLPGHGGFLDRLDSILPSAVVAYVLFLLFA
ncbi:phosphatidate cytidylyltransferase [Glaciibacter flavus]|uniref:phosphatidate cytidylyltransferase n=1 Tax=Orlajensenia flava TaxID=2565934 RepID=UPI001F28FB04|nr:phosphatidate cytidylyltransferase [Glaciibacter flavus]